MSLIPTNCPSCNTKLVIDGIHLICPNHKTCPEQNILLILHWIVNAGVEHFAESSVRALYDAGVLKSVKDLYILTPESFEGIEGFGSRKIANALSEIERTKTMDLPTFVDLLSIELVGKKGIAKLGIKTFKEFMNWTDETYVIGKNIKEFVAANRDFINDLAKVVVIKEAEIVKVSVGAKKIAMTGSGPDKRDNLIERIKSNGDIFHDGIHSDTDILLCEDKNSGTSKLAKAAKLGIKIMNYSEYF